MRSFWAVGQLSMGLVPGSDLFAQLQGAVGDAALEGVVGLLQGGVSQLQLGLGASALVDMLVEQTVFFGEEEAGDQPQGSQGAGACQDPEEAAEIPPGWQGEDFQIARLAHAQEEGFGLAPSASLEEADAGDLQLGVGGELFVGLDLEAGWQDGLENDGTALQNQGLGGTQPSITDEAGLDLDQLGVGFVGEDLLRRQEKGGCIGDRAGDPGPGILEGGGKVAGHGKAENLDLFAQARRTVAAHEADEHPTALILQGDGLVLSDAGDAAGNLDAAGDILTGLIPGEVGDAPGRGGEGIGGRGLVHLDGAGVGDVELNGNDLALLVKLTAGGAAQGDAGVHEWFGLGHGHGGAKGGGDLALSSHEVKPTAMVPFCDGLDDAANFDPLAVELAGEKCIQGRSHRSRHGGLSQDLKSGLGDRRREIARGGDSADADALAGTNIYPVAGRGNIDGAAGVLHKDSPPERVAKSHHRFQPHRVTASRLGATQSANGLDGLQQRQGGWSGGRRRGDMVAWRGRRTRRQKHRVFQDQFAVGQAGRAKDVHAEIRGEIEFAEELDLDQAGGIAHGDEARSGLYQRIIQFKMFLIGFSTRGEMHGRGSTVRAKK